MKKFLLVVGAFFFAISSPAFAAVVYSGAQNVALTLDGTSFPLPPLVEATIDIAGDTSDGWDDFQIEMWVPGMGPGVYLTISGSGMGATMGSLGIVSNLASGDLISSSSSFGGDLLLWADGGVTQDGEFYTPGYVGLLMYGSGGEHYGWLHMSSISDIGLNTQSVTFDGWAYEDVAGVSIAAGATTSAAPIPAPSALLLGSLGTGLVVWLRRRRAV